MRDEQIQGKVPKRLTRRPTAITMIRSQRMCSTATLPRRRWVGDTTEFVIGDNAKLYLAAILDLYSRFVVGWVMSAVNDGRLTLKALEERVELLRHHSRARGAAPSGLVSVRRGQ
jgi:transposase InsO family protein